MNIEPGPNPDTDITDGELAEIRKAAALTAEAAFVELENAHQTVAGELAAAQDQIEALTERLAILDADPPPAPAAPAPPTAAPPAGDAHVPEPVYASYGDWAEQWFGPTLTRRNLRTSCETWWKHPEARLRLDALWRTWEQARLDSVSGMADWLTSQADPHLEQLTAVDGPFCGCDAHTHELPAPVLGYRTRTTPEQSLRSNVVELDPTRVQTLNPTLKEQTK